MPCFYGKQPNEEEGADYADDFETEGGGGRSNRKANGGVGSEQQDAMNRLVTCVT